MLLTITLVSIAFVKGLPGNSTFEMLYTYTCVLSFPKDITRLTSSTFVPS